MSQLAVDTKHILVLGIGSLGFALLEHLGRSIGDRCRLSAFDGEEALRQSLRATRRHGRLFPGIALSERVEIVDDLSAVADCDLLVLAIESPATQDVMLRVEPHLRRPLRVLNTAKALDGESGRRLSAIVAEALGPKLYSYSLLAGGMTAADLISGDPLGVTLASSRPEDLAYVGELLDGPALFLHPTEDLVGAEYASAFGNVLGVFAGIVNGAGLSAGAHAYLVATAARELAELAVRLGAERATFGATSAGWANEIYMSGAAMTPSREFGVLLGRGFGLVEALALLSERNRNVEGYRTIKALGRLDALDAAPHVSALFDFVVGATSLAELFDAVFRVSGSGAARWR